LLKVNGVGAKVALAILSNLSADEFINCVATKEVAVLVRVPGIGKITAERLLIELQDKVATLGVGAVPSGESLFPDEQSVRTQAEEALASLGYKPAEAKKLLDKAATADQTVEQMIRAALRGASK
jgi:Holliday junction DNA helicase RuvA